MEELQNVATFLIADGCEWLTGQTITVDGGQSRATGSNFYELRHLERRAMAGCARGYQSPERKGPRAAWDVGGERPYGASLRDTL
jgi:hypothetical protein